MTKNFVSLFGGAWLLLALQAAPLAAEALENTARELRDEVRRFDIASQSLSTALLAFGQQSSLQISVDSQLLQGLQAPAVHGSLHSRVALNRLLQGTGISWQAIDEDSLLLERAAEQSQGLVQLYSTLVRSETLEYQGERTVDRHTIDALPAGNGDITSLLRSNPNVQFDDSQLSSKTPGEIAPANISINGARPWQNLFVVDGMTMNNDLDPGQTAHSATELPGRSQGLALDTDLLENIRVYDSNVPASYGGFNGGVIQVDTRQPSEALHGKVSMQTTRSSWTEYHVDEEASDYAEFEAAVGNANQPEFDKLTTRASLEGHLTETFGLLGSFSRKESTIPTRNFGLSHTTATASEEHEQIRRIDNYFLKAAWQINGDWHLDMSLIHAPEINRGYVSNAINSRFELKQGGDSFGTVLRWSAPWAQVEQSLSWSELETSRETDTDYMRVWRPSVTNNWSSGSVASDGSHGDLQQQQESLAYKLKADWSHFDTFALGHNVQTGIELSTSDAYYERPQDYYSNAVTALASTPACVGSDPWCSPGRGTGAYSSWPAQYARAYTLTEAGKIDLSTAAWAVFIQDEMRLGRLSLRPGVRLDGDDYMEQVTVSPRLALDLDIFGDDRTHLTAGANRYYGRNLAAYRLRDGVASMQVAYSRTSQTAPWVRGKRAANGAKFSQLDIPYDDELNLGLSQVLWNTELAFKYVNRKGRDQISRAWGAHIDQPTGDPASLSANYYTYYNGGESDSDIYTLTITPQSDFNLWGTRTGGQLALDSTDVFSSGLSDYTSSIGLLYVEDPIIQYDGKFMHYSHRPADNYNRPWTLRLTSITDIAQWNLSWSNFLRYRDGYRKMAGTSKTVPYQGMSVRVWEETEYSGALVWDTRLGWELPFDNTQAVFVNLDVSNLLNKAVVNNVESNSDDVEYEIGRQFMAEVGYRF